MSLTTTLFAALIVTGFTLLSCGRSETSSSPPPTSTTLTDGDLQQIGDSLAVELGTGNSALFDSLFNPVALYRRLAWPAESNAKDEATFLRGYDMQVASQGSLGEQLAAQWGGEEGVSFIRVRRDSMIGPLLLFRILADDGINYAELLIEDVEGEPVISDIRMWTVGEFHSAMLRRTFAQAGSNPVRRLLDRAGTDPEQLVAAITRMNDLVVGNQSQEALDYSQELPDAIRNQKMIQVLRVQAATSIEKEGVYENVVNEMRALFPNDPGLDLHLIDYFFIREEWDSALASIDRLDRYVNDPYLDQMRGNLSLMREDFDAAQRFAEELIAHDSLLSDPYILLASIGIKTDDNALIADALGRMQRNNAGIIQFDVIDSEPTYDMFRRSPEYRALKRTHASP